MMDESQINRIEFRTGLVLQRLSGEWRFTDPPWFGKAIGGGGRTWLALTAFKDLDSALEAAAKALPAYVLTFEAVQNLSRARQHCYRTAMEASAGARA